MKAAQLGEGETMLPHGAQSPQGQGPWTLPEAAPCAVHAPLFSPCRLHPLPVSFPNKFTAHLLSFCSAVRTDNTEDKDRAWTTLVLSVTMPFSSLL